MWREQHALPSVAELPFSLCEKTDFKDGMTAMKLSAQAGANA